MGNKGVQRHKARRTVTEHMAGWREARCRRDKNKSDRRKRDRGKKGRVTEHMARENSDRS